MLHLERNLKETKDRYFTLQGFGNTYRKLPAWILLYLRDHRWLIAKSSLTALRHQYAGTRERPEGLPSQ